MSVNLLIEMEIHLFVLSGSDHKCNSFQLINILRRQPCHHVNVSKNISETGKLLQFSAKAVSAF